MNKINLYDKVVLYPDKYDERMLNRTRNKPQDRVYLLVIRVEEDTLLIRYPDGVANEISKASVITNLTLTPAHPEYWKDSTIAIQKQIIYDPVFKRLCENYGVHSIIDTPVTNVPQHDVVPPKRNTTSSSRQTPSANVIINSALNEIDCAISDLNNSSNRLEELAKKLEDLRR